MLSPKTRCIIICITCKVSFAHYPKQITQKDSATALSLQELPLVKQPRLKACRLISKKRFQMVL